MDRNYSQRLKEVLFLLASSPDVQICVFPEFVHIPDEIASEASDAIEFAPSELCSADLSILSVLRKIDKLFEEEGENPDNWTIESVKNDPLWQQARMLAQEEINRQRLSYKTPVLFWTTYYRSQPSN